MLRQPASPDTRFVAEFLEGPVKAALAHLSPLRVLLRVASGIARSGQLVLVDDKGKTRVRAELRAFEATMRHMVRADHSVTSGGQSDQATP